jgi:hypothetical protein
LLSIENDDTSLTVCPCCGGPSLLLTRFLSRSSGCHAAYLALLPCSHAERTAAVLVVLGEAFAESTQGQRIAVALELRATDAQYEVTVVDGAHSPWSGAEHLGALLGRRQALAHHAISDIFEISDHIIAHDRAVRDYLDGVDEGGGATLAN